jgi:hypothetical protein
MGSIFLIEILSWADTGSCKKVNFNSEANFYFLVIDIPIKGSGIAQLVKHPPMELLIEGLKHCRDRHFLHTKSGPGFGLPEFSSFSKVRTLFDKYFM